MSARVRSVTSDSACSRSISPVAGSESTKTGRAPKCSIALAHDTKVMLGRSTSSPGPSSSIRSPIVRPAVQDDRHLTCGDVQVVARADPGTPATFGPVVSQPERIASSSSSISSSPICGALSPRYGRGGAWADPL